MSDDLVKRLEWIASYCDLGMYAGTVREAIAALKSPATSCCKGLAPLSECQCEKDRLATPPAPPVPTASVEVVAELLAGLAAFDHMMSCHVGIGYFDGTEITREWDQLVRPAMERLKTGPGVSEAERLERQTFKDAAAINVENDRLREALHDLLTRPTDGAARQRAREALASLTAPTQGDGEPVAWLVTNKATGTRDLQFKPLADLPFNRDRCTWEPLEHAGSQALLEANRRHALLLGRICEIIQADGEDDDPVRIAQERMDYIRELETTSPGKRIG